MRVVTTLDASSDWQQAGIDRHALMLSTFINSGKNALLSPEFRTMTLVVRSAVSDPALALLGMKDELLTAENPGQSYRGQVGPRGWLAAALCRSLRAFTGQPRQRAYPLGQEPAPCGSA